MKNLLKAIVILTSLLLMMIGAKVYAETPTLEEITEAFNNCTTVKNYASYGSVWEATTNGDKLNISVKANETDTNLEYTLEGNILSGNFSGEDALTGMVVTLVLTDSMGQFYGYEEGEIAKTLNSDEASNYTVENEGFELKEISEESYTIKIDISKKIPLVDFSNVYIKVEDLENLKEYIFGDGSAQISKGNVWFNKSGYDGENDLIVAEKGKLTENTYKSIISILEVMFDNEDVIKYFRNNFKDLSGNKEFDGFNIRVNPVNKTDWEESLIPEDSDYELVSLTINKTLAIQSADKKDNKEENNLNTALVVVSVVVGIVAIGTIAFVLMKKRE